MRIETSYACHPGKRRANNQDNLYYQGKVLQKDHRRAGKAFPSKWDTGELLCFGVFDGMGGEQYGELASYLAADITKEILSSQTDERIPSDLLYEICKKANKVILKKTVELKAERIGTTIAMVMLRYDTIWCCNIGDSKIFRLRGEEFTQLSMDHVAAYAEDPERKPGLTAHLGMGPTEIFPNPYMINETIMPEDIYLICSDGITDMVSLADIQMMIRGNRIGKSVRSLLRRALDQGGHDNATMVLIKVIEEGGKRRK